MSDIAKGMLLCFITCIAWSALCFCGGYIYCNRNATKQIERANNELAEQQRKYDELIRTTDERIRNIKSELSATLTDNGTTIMQLQELVEQVRKQRVNI